MSDNAEDTVRLPEDVMNILIATDIHLGYNEKDSIRGEDSFKSFEEILQLAVEHDVDFILLGGDLFHDARPSHNCLLQCLKLLRKYTLGDRPISVEFLSDQTVNFQESPNGTVNYEDPNINISIPVFSIHGNHDDPSGFGRLSSLDLLSYTGLVNYFGKWTDLSRINMSPLLLRKGCTKLALYGLSYIKNERLTRLFSDGLVTLERPSEDTDEYFNIFTLHQNRANRGVKTFVPEEVLPDFLDLVVWGHEHECRIVPEFNAVSNIYITQPGSPVATSLAQGESVEKHCAVLHIYRKEFVLEPVKLKTVRPFIFQDIDLRTLEDEIDLTGPNVSENVQVYIREKVQSMIEESKVMLTGHPDQPSLPLLRLRVVYFDEQQLFNAMRFGQSFGDEIANPTDLLIMKKTAKARVKTDLGTIDKKLMENAAEKELRNSEARVEDIIIRYFTEIQEKALPALSVKAMCEAVIQCVDKGDDDAINEIIKHQASTAITHLKQSYPPLEMVEDEIRSYADKVALSEQDAINMLQKRQITLVAKTSNGKNSTSTMDGSSDDEETMEKTKKSRAAAKTTRGGKGSRGGRGSRGGGRSKTVSLDISIGKTTTDVTTTGKEKGRGRKAATVQPSITSAFKPSQSPVRAFSPPKPSPTSHRKTKQIIYVDDSD